MTVGVVNIPLILNLLKDGRIGDHPVNTGCRHSGRLSTVIPAYAGIRRRDGKGLVFSVPFGVPAYAGMTVERRPE